MRVIPFFIRTRFYELRRNLMSEPSALYAIMVASTINCCNYFRIPFSQKSVLFPSRPLRLRGSFFREFASTAAEQSQIFVTLSSYIYLYKWHFLAVLHFALRQVEFMNEVFYHTPLNPLSLPHRLDTEGTYLRASPLRARAGDDGERGWGCVKKDCCTTAA
jgi:hypothetical protein